MKLKIISTLLIVTPWLASANEVGYGPWKFGMTKEEVAAIEKFGPYEDIKSTGGLETFNAEFDGDRMNISFVFEKNGLSKIQIWIYEGKDPEEALAGWLRVSKFLMENFGEVEFPKANIPQDANLRKIQSTYQNIITNFPENKISKVQMGLKEMPNNINVYASLFKHPTHGYYVFLYYTNP